MLVALSFKQVSKGHLAIATLLLSKGAASNSADKNLSTVLHKAAAKGDPLRRGCCFPVDTAVSEGGPPDPYCLMTDVCPCVDGLLLRKCGDGFAAAWPRRQGG